MILQDKTWEMITFSTTWFFAGTKKSVRGRALVSTLWSCEGFLLPRSELQMRTLALLKGRVSKPLVRAVMNPWDVSVQGGGKPAWVSGVQMLIKG